MAGSRKREAVRDSWTSLTSTGSSCAFLIHQLSQAERNADVSNREMLAIKLVLEKWHDWFEGAKFPLIVWTNNKIQSNE